MSAYLDSDGLPRIGVLLKEGDPTTGGGGVHIKCIGDLSILVVCSLSCHCVPTV